MNFARFIAVVFLFIGVVFITIGYTKMTVKCPPPRIEYRFIPQNVYEEQIYNNKASTLFQGMFENESVKTS